jgi:hypothetical protein
LQAAASVIFKAHRSRRTLFVSRAVMLKKRFSVLLLCASDAAREISRENFETKKEAALPL